MLLSLDIRNVVLIDHLTMAFRSGLCALTGETGAGKSILLDSLGLALGMRAESGLVRHGEKEASVTATFRLPEKHTAHQMLEAAGIIQEDDMLLLRRVVSEGGKSRAFINDQPVSIGLLRSVGETLVEIHGQFDTQGLLNPATHRAMLDDYAGVDGTALSTLWEAWKDAEDALEDMRRRAQKAQSEEAYWRGSLVDLEALDPQVGEEQDLMVRRDRVKHRVQILETLAAADRILDTEDDPVRKSWALLERVADKMGEALSPALEALSRASSEMQEAAERVRALCNTYTEQEERLEDIDDRLYALRVQARKHACVVDDLPRVREDLIQNLRLVEHGGEALSAQEKNVVAACAHYQEEALRVRALRQKTAYKLDALVQAELAPLKLEKARFITQVEVLDAVEWGAHGMDHVRFLVSTNAGAQAGALHKIASGGEMSRFMLALKVVIAQEGSTHSFIFDEVDTGIGGSTADAVGERLARLAQNKQVLVVTHAPQVAARADHHWVVEKTANTPVRTTITPLTTRPARCEEIARMLAGAEVTKEARAAAERLLRVG